MNKPTHFLFFDEYENKWVQATAEELSMRNDPDLYVTPVYETENGPSCTWGDFPQKHKEYEQKKQQEAIQRRKEQKRLQEETNRLNQQKQIQEEEDLKKEQEEKSREFMATYIRQLAKTVEPTCKLVRFTCRFFVVVFCLNCIFAGLTVGLLAFKEQPLGIVIGAALGFACIFLVRVIVSSWASADND